MMLQRDCEHGTANMHTSRTLQQSRIPRRVVPLRWPWFAFLGLGDRHNGDADCVVAMVVFMMFPFVREKRADLMITCQKRA